MLLGLGEDLVAHFARVCDIDHKRAHGMISDSTSSWDLEVGWFLVATEGDKDLALAHSLE